MLQPPTSQPQAHNATPIAVVPVWNVTRQLGLRLLGRDGYRFATKASRHLLKWLVYVLLAEIGTAGTFGLLSLFRAEASIAGMSAIAIHTGIVVAGLLGFMLAMLLDGVDNGLKRLASLLDRIELLAAKIVRIRRLWKGET